MNNKNNCITCQHHFITYDSDKPWGCRRFGFKSKISPKFEVKKETGMDCAYYILKKKINIIQQENYKDGEISE